MNGGYNHLFISLVTYQNLMYKFDDFYLVKNNLTIITSYIYSIFKFKFHSLMQIHPEKNAS